MITNQVRTTYTASDSLIYRITFPYSDQSEIRVATVDADGLYVDIFNWEFYSKDQIRFTSTPPEIFNIYRNTDISRAYGTPEYAVFNSGSMINASDLNGNLELLRRGIEENQNLLQDILFEGGEGAYDGRYILRNGDTGIGDLSFGTNGSITLDASNGSASFASSRFNIDSDGGAAVVYQGADDATPCLDLYVPNGAATTPFIRATNGLTEVASINADGSAEFTGQITLPGGGTGSQAATVDQITSAVDGAPYVKVAGDNMTGDLTLGTDKITLKTDGSGAFQGGITSGSNSQTGYLQCTGNGSTHGYIFAGNTNGYTAALNYKDKAGNGAAFIASDNNGNDIAKVDWFGGATFAGDIKLGNTSSAINDGGIELNQNLGQIDIIKASADSGYYLTGVQSNGAGGVVNRFNIAADGSALFGQFPSSLEINSDTVVKFNNSDEANIICRKTDSLYNASNAFEVQNNAGNVTASITGDGSAEFANRLDIRGGVLTDGGSSLSTGLYYRDDSESHGLSLYSNGSLETNRKVFIKTDGSATFAYNVEMARLVVDGSKATIGDYYTVIKDSSGDIIGGWTNANGSFNVGGTLPSDPNIELRNDGSATFAGQITANDIVVQQSNDTFPVYRGLAVNGTNTSRIDGDGSATFAGNVGIGTTSPDTALHVVGAATSTQLLLTDATNATIRMGTPAAGIGILSVNTGQNLVFGHQSAAGSTYTERMRIDSSGNVGIGGNGTGSGLGVYLQRGGGTSNHFYEASDGTKKMIAGIDATLTYAKIGSLSNHDLGFVTNNGLKMLIDSSGNVGIGTTSPLSELHLHGPTSGVGPIFNLTNDTGDCRIFFGQNTSTGSANAAGQIRYNVANNTLGFYTNLNERMRINNKGETGVACDSTGWSFGVYQGGTAGTTNYLITGNYGSSTPLSGGTRSFGVFTNGNVVNTNDSYGAISDIKLKENIVDADSQWDDFKAVRFRKYNFKEETGHETFTQLGVIAQELEQVCPGLVDETPDRDEEGNDLGTTTKSVKYSILTKKALVALQEAMERIETLEQRLTDAGL